MPSPPLDHKTKVPIPAPQIAVQPVIQGDSGIGMRCGHRVRLSQSGANAIQVVGHLRMASQHMAQSLVGELNLIPLFVSIPTQAALLGSFGIALYDGRTVNLTPSDTLTPCAP